MIDYAFGSGGYKLGERVEILTTGQRGILINETVHISGCNTYLILLPNVLKDGKMKVTNRDYLMLKKLEPGESIFEQSKELTDENSFSITGIEVDPARLQAAISEEKEFIPEIDDAADVEELFVKPGMEVWNKVYGKIMMITHVIRDIYSKELAYGAVYMVEEKEEYIVAHRYAFVPLGQKINVQSAEKRGPNFEDGRSQIETGNIERMNNYLGNTCSGAVMERTA